MRFPSLSRYGWRRPTRAAALAALVLTIGVSLFRYVDFDAPVLYATVPFGPVAAAFAAISAAATFGRKAAATAVAGVVITMALALPGRIAPRLGCDVRAAGNDADIVLLSHNVEVRADNASEVAAQITTVDPDVVLLQESEAPFVERLLDSLDGAYPHVARSVGTGTTSMVTLSRWPLTDVVDTWDPDRPVNPSLVTTVETPAGPLRVANIHLSAPTRGWLQKRQELEYADLLAPPFQTEVDVLMGDFNSSSSHVAHRRLIDSGFTDAHRVAGCGLGTTWSPLGFGGAVLPLDHLLTAPHARVESFETLDDAGSDHRAIAAALTLAVPSAG